MNLFLTKLSKFLFFLYIFFWVLQIIVDNGLKRNNSFTYNKINKINSGKINADLVFLGSSRAYKHFNPEIFDERLKLNTYNLGSNGVSFDLQKISNNAYFKNNILPKIIVQNIDITAFTKTDFIFDKKQYFPYYSFNNYKTLSKIDKTVSLEFLIPIYKFRGHLDVFKDAYNGYFKKYKVDETKKGFGPSNLNWNNKFEKRKKDKNKYFNFSNINYKERFLVFENLLKDLKETGAIIFLVWSPEYYERQELSKESTNMISKYVSNIASKNKKIFFLNFTKDSLCLKKDFFYDSYHLNNIGVNIFSNKVVDSILKKENMQLIIDKKMDDILKIGL